jgi:hypothetical protein
MNEKWSSFDEDAIERSERCAVELEFFDKIPSEGLREFCEWHMLRVKYSFH